MSQTSAPILTAENVHKTYVLGRVRVPVLRGLSMAVRPGELLAILGASGSGKSTLLHLLGGLDRPDRASSSRIVFENTALSSMSQRGLNRYRRSSVGFVFQFYHLLPELSVLENVLISAMVRHGRREFRVRRNELSERARLLLDRFGLGERLKHRPRELSGGERQRVAIARALVNEPTVLLADEPTGNLDQETGAGILDALDVFRGESGQTMVVVTHDEQTAGRADRVIRLRDGVVESEA